MRKKIIVIAFGGVVLVAAGALAFVLWPEDAPDPSAQTPKQITEYMASKEFAKLDEAQKREYFDKAVGKLSGQGRGRRPGRMFRSQMSEEERKRLRENVGPMFRRMAEERVDRYFELPPEQRTAYLDEIIDGMAERRRQAQERRRQREQQPATRPAEQDERRRRGRRGFTPERMKRRIENTPPERRAKFAEFMKVLRKRMEERGISHPRRPRRRR